MWGRRSDAAGTPNQEEDDTVVEAKVNDEGEAKSDEVEAKSNDFDAAAAQGDTAATAEDAEVLAAAKMARPCELHDHGETPMHFAARKGNTNAICTLAKHRKEIVMHPRHDGATPLHVAAESLDTPEALWELINLIAQDPTAEAEDFGLTKGDVEGNTPLHYAARGNNLAGINVLVEAARNRKGGVLQNLISKRNKAKLAAIDLPELKDSKAIETLLASGADIMSPCLCGTRLKLEYLDPQVIGVPSSMRSLIAGHPAIMNMLINIANKKTELYHDAQVQPS